MSLSIYLSSEEGERECTCECGNVHMNKNSVILFHTNWTHNLNKMSAEAGIYGILWRPEENGIKLASDLVEPFEKGLELMKSDPSRFQKFDSSNGWGLYIHFIPLLEEYLSACKKYPNSIVQAYR